MGRIEERGSSGIKNSRHFKNRPISRITYPRLQLLVVPRRDAGLEGYCLLSEV